MASLALTAPQPASAEEQLQLVYKDIQGVARFALAGMATHHETWSPRERAQFSVALGRVVAHEVLHVLVPNYPTLRGVLDGHALRPSLLHWAVAAQATGATHEALAPPPLIQE